MTKDFIEQLYEDEADNLYYFVMKCVYDKETAKDIVQEAFYIALRRRDELENHPNLTGWLYQAAKYIILSESRKNRKWDFNCNYEDLKEKIRDEKAEKDMKDVEEDSFRTVLKEKDYMLLDLMYIQGYTSKDIAGMLGMNESTLRVRLMRIKKKLKDRGA